MIKQIVIASQNKGKLDEFRRLFGPESGIELIVDERFIPPDEVEPTYYGNATLKAIVAARQCCAFALGEDSGIEIMALNGMPGPLSARFAALPEEMRAELIENPSVRLMRLAACLRIDELPSAAENNELLLQLIREQAEYALLPIGARYVSHLVLVDPYGGVVLRVECSAYGRILNFPTGTGGFGHDPIISLWPHVDRSVAQLTPVEKDAVSHRGQAVRLLLEHLRRSV